MEVALFLGVIAAVIGGNLLTACFLYAIFWGDAQKRRGKNDNSFPNWWVAAMTVPPLVAGCGTYVALY